MALGATLLQFKIQVSDVDRGFYETLELRVARHPSESAPYLLTRVIAYALNAQQGIEFSAGISSPDDAPIYVKDLTGAIVTWIDIGNPAAKRVHKASKAAKNVRIYTYRDPRLLLDEMTSEPIHRVQTIEVFSLSPSFVRELEVTIEKLNSWELLLTQGELAITVRGKTIAGEIQAHRIA